MNAHHPEARPPALHTLGLGLALIALALVLHRLGRGPLRSPASGGLDEIERWIDDVGPVTATLAVVRPVALGACLYGSALVTLGSVARLTHHHALGRATSSLTLPPLRGALTAATGLTLTTVGLVASPAAGASDAAASGASDSIVVIERLPDHPGSDPHLDAEAETATMRQPSVDARPEAGDAEAPESDPDVAPKPPAPEPWRVKAGDHVWHVAEATLAAAWGRAPTDPETATYWSQLLDANRSQLIDPDLLRPGQTLVRPTPPHSPR